MTRLREITPEEIKQALERPSSFGYRGDRDMFETWSLGPTIDMRDADLVLQSNGFAMKAELERLEEAGEIEADSWEVTGCDHWGFGYVGHLSFKALDADGDPTRVFSHIMEMVDCIQEYVVLDSSDHSQREYDAQLESIEQNAPSLKDELPEEWQRKVFSWLWDNQQEKAFGGDDRAYISEDCVRAACEALGFAEEEDDE